MDIHEVSELTKIPVKILLKMQTRPSGSFKAGPPFHKILTSHGQLIYVYLKSEVKKWMAVRRCQITAADAAELMGISRAELLEFFGLRGFNLKHGKYEGRLIINNGKNQYIWIPKPKKK